jgi:hypothetical protein
VQNFGWCRRRGRKRPYLDALALAALVFAIFVPSSVCGPTATGVFFFSKASFTDAGRRGSAASFRIFSAICVASECLRECVGMSPPRLISIAEPLYGEKTCRSLVKLAQMAGMGDAEDCLCSEQDLITSGPMPCLIVSPREILSLGLRSHPASYIVGDKEPFNLCRGVTSV